MDLRKLKTLIELVETSGIAELEIQEGEERVRITRAGAPGPQTVMLHAAPQVAAPAPAAAVAVAEPAAPPAPEGGHLLSLGLAGRQAVRGNRRHGAAGRYAVHRGGHEAHERDRGRRGRGDQGDPGGERAGGGVRPAAVRDRLTQPWPTPHPTSRSTRS